MTKEQLKKQGPNLNKRIFFGIIFGMIFGIGANLAVNIDIISIPLHYIKTIFEYIGEIFIRLLRMLIVPLIFTSIYISVSHIRSINDLSRLGRKTIGFYMLTTSLAVLVGLLVVNLINPGQGIDYSVLDSLNIATKIPETIIQQGVGERSAFLVIIDTFVQMIPKNPVEAMAQGNMLQIIFFAIFIAIIASIVGERSISLGRVVESFNIIVHKGIIIIMYIAPYAIFALISTILMDLGLPALQALAKYSLTVVLGLLIHASITLPLLVMLLGQYNPIYLLKAMSPALLTAWSTASSAVTLPITMNNLENRAGIKNRVSNFVLPLGATMNMDGTALYESVAVIFIAQLLGIDLNFSTQVIIFITASLAAVGAAAIPGAGLVTMGIVLTAVGLPLEGIGLILAVDRILDQFRTMINVWGDAIIAVIVAYSERDLNYH